MKGKTTEAIKHLVSKFSKDIELMERGTSVSGHPVSNGNFKFFDTMTFKFKIFNKKRMDEILNYYNKKYDLEYNYSTDRQSKLTYIHFEIPYSNIQNMIRHIKISQFINNSG